ncbi:unnamed protein product [Polarella glacialis]|uniref:Ankyrin repeat protein n=1 Tax=Polarella glacialis TaxID=89957 RepID=A0A813H1S2_POLGL|nr:unnamed protein product [Polarella glacialis]
MNTTCNGGNTPLHVSARSGHADAVKFLIAKQATLNIQNRNGWTPLMWCAINGHEDCASVLVDAVSDFALQDIDGKTALMWAAQHGHFEIVNLLLAAGDDPSRTDEHGRTAADHSQHHAELRSVIAQLVRVNEALIEAAERCDVVNVRRCLKAGAQIDHYKEDGLSALVWAALHGSLDMVQLLIKEGASTSLVSASEFRLETTWSHFHKEVKASLAESEAMTVKFLTSARLGDWEGLQFALERCVSVSAREETSLRNALHGAASHGSAEVILDLVSLKIGVEQVDAFGWTPVHYAAMGGHIEALAMLHHLRANLDAQTYLGESAIRFAACADDASMVQLLLAASSNVEEKDIDGLSLVQLAASKGAASAFRTLWMCQADVQATDSEGRTCFHRAIEGGHLSILETLLAVPRPLSRVRQEHLLDARLRDAEKYAGGGTSFEPPNATHLSLQIILI